MNRNDYDDENEMCVRIALLDVPLRGATVLLTDSSIVVRCDTPPAVGEIVEVDLFLPGSSDAVPARAIVRQRTVGTFLAGFRAQFLDLDAAVRSALALCVLRDSRTGGFGHLPANTI
jgi:hypothetical protein